MHRRWLLFAAALFGAGWFVRTYPGHDAGIPIAVAANCLIAAPSWLALRRWLGGTAAALLGVILAAYTYLIEGIGVVTGVPYGSFGYGSGLGPLLAGTVPVLLPLAYVPLVLGAAAVACRGPLHRRASPIVLPIVIGALVLLAADLVLDPGAVRLGYWRYAAGGVYHGVPASNFAGWLVSGSIAMAIVCGFVALLARRRGQRAPSCAAPTGLATSAFLVMAFWSGIALWHGLIVPGLLGLAMVALFWSAARAEPAAD